MLTRPRRLIHALLLLVISLPTSAFAQTSEDAALALELYDLLKIESAVAAAIDQHVETMKLGEQQRREIYANYRREVAAMMSRVYTGQELVALKDFYASEIGQSVIRKQGEVGAQYANVLIRVLSEHREPVESVQ